MQNFVYFLILQSSRWERESPGCFSFIVFWMSYRCYRSLPLTYGAAGWSVVYECGISSGFPLLAKEPA